MRITGIEVTDFLSFDSFQWSELNPRLNVVVGPNDAGKSNLMHAVRTVVDVLRASGERRSEWAAAVRLGAPAPAFRISLDLVLTAEWEKELLRVFLAAAFCNVDDIRHAFQLPNPPININMEQGQLARWAAFVLREIKPETLACFERGPTAGGTDGKQEQPWQKWTSPKTELVWPGKYNEDGTRRETPRVNLPFQVIEGPEHGINYNETNSFASPAHRSAALVERIQEHSRRNNAGLRSQLTPVKGRGR